jgi:hypothetical protein
MLALGKIKAMGAIKKEPRAGARGCKSLPQLRLLEKAAAGVAAIAAPAVLAMEIWYLLRSNVMQSTIFHFATRESEQSHALMFSPITHFSGQTLCVFSQHEKEPLQRERRRRPQWRRLSLLAPVGLWGRWCGRSAVKDGGEASFDETKAQYESRTSVGRRRLVVGTGERSSRSS